jgi:hypothetical protein
VNCRKVLSVVVCSKFSNCVEGTWGEERIKEMEIEAVSKMERFIKFCDL